VDFIYFVRKRALQPKAFRKEDLRDALLNAELGQLSRDEAHLEKEFED